MAHKYAEIEYESRGMDLTLTGMSQTFVLVFFIDPEIEPETTSSDGEYPGTNVFDYDEVPFDEDYVALEYAYTLLPEVRLLPNQAGELKLLTIQNLKLDKVGPYTWRATTTYSYDVNTGTGGERPTEEEPDVLPYVKYNFTIGGGSREITKSIAASSPVLASGALIPAVPDLGGLIGVTSDGVKGTTVPETAFRLQITAYYIPQSLTLEFG